MLENHMVLPGPRKYYASTCNNRGQEFEPDSRPRVDEDGAPDYDFRTTPCAGGCGTEICEHCVENGAAFVCEDGGTCCAKCAAEEEDRNRWLK